MRRIWVNPENIHGDKVELTDEAFHHAVQVTRLKVGDQLQLISGQGEVVIAEIESIKKKSASLKVTARKALPKIEKPHVNLAVGLCKWNIFEEVLEKATELGVHTLQPLLTEHSFIKNKKDLTQERQERWLKIVQSATAQSQRGDLMHIPLAVDLATFIKDINQNPKAKCLFAFEGLGDGDVATELRHITQADPDQIWALVGSEGGFSSKEVDLLRSHKIPPVTMGPQILRAETACFALVSVIKYQADLMR